MKFFSYFLLALTGAFLIQTLNQKTMSQNTVYDFTMTSINGEKINLSTYKGKVLLIVNVASKCGLTPQYEDLEALYTEKKEEGLVILGFPANNFLSQEPGTNEEIMSFCAVNYGVSFPMFSKISVKGSDIDPLYDFLTHKDKNGVYQGKVKWNFQKFLIGKDGKLISSIEPTAKVTDPEVKQLIEGALKREN